MAKKAKTKTPEPEAAVEPLREPVDLTEVEGVGPATAEKIAKAGFGTLDALRAVTAGTLVDAVDGLGEETAERLVAWAAESEPSVAEEAAVAGPTEGRLEEVVDYHDHISGEPRPARVAGIGPGGVRDLAVFKQGGIAFSRPGVERGHGKGQWLPREAK